MTQRRIDSLSLMYKKSSDRGDIPTASRRRGGRIQLVIEGSRGDRRSRVAVRWSRRAMAGPGFTVARAPWSPARETCRVPGVARVDVHLIENREAQDFTVDLARVPVVGDLIDLQGTYFKVNSVTFGIGSAHEAQIPRVVAEQYGS